MAKQTLASRFDSFGGVSVIAVLLGVSQQVMAQWRAAGAMPQRQAHWLAIFTKTKAEDIPVTTPLQPLTRGAIIDKIEEIKMARAWLETAQARVEAQLEQLEAA